MAIKEVKHEYLWESVGQKYFLVKRSDEESFIFRTPGKQEEKSKDRVELLNWEGEIIHWGNIPKKIRKWVAKKNFKPSEKNTKVLIPK